MEARKWEELPMDCLVDVLGRVGLESLLLDVPFVCKSWYKATLSPYCWQKLDFPHISRYSSLLDPFTSRFDRQYQRQGDIFTTKLVKGVVDRSVGCATAVRLPSCCSKEALTYVADNCPALKILVIHSTCSDTINAMPFVIGKLKYLEVVGIPSLLLFKDIVTEIGAHCENFVSFCLVESSAFFPDIGHVEVTALVSCLPKIKSLVLRNVFIERENLIKILKGCRELEYLVVCDCRGFDESDVELLKLASHIPTFKCSVDYDDCVYYVDSGYYSD